MCVLKKFHIKIWHVFIHLAKILLLLENLSDKKQTGFIHYLDILDYLPIEEN